MMAARPGRETDRDPPARYEDLVCESCDDGRMRRTREPRSPVLRVVGFTLWADAVVMLILGMGPGSRRSIGIPIMCLLLCAAGLFLTLKREVWRCSTCGHLKHVARRRSAWFPSLMSPRTD